MSEEILPPVPFPELIYRFSDAGAGQPSPDVPDFFFPLESPVLQKRIVHDFLGIRTAPDNPQTGIVQSSGHGFIQLFYFYSVFHQVSFSHIRRSDFDSVANV